MPRILVFGDSISHGYYDKEKGGWTQRLNIFLTEKKLSNSEIDYPVYDLGISGNTTEEILKRFETETKARFEEDKKPIIIFAIGINDSYFVETKGSVEVSLDKFTENIQKIIDLAKNFSSTIIFIGLTPVEEEKVNPMPWAPDKTWNNEIIKKYNDTIKKICKANEIYFIEIFEKLIVTNYRKLLEDGGHPNSKGHQKIYEIVRDFLLKNNLIK